MDSAREHYDAVWREIIAGRLQDLLGADTLASAPDIEVLPGFHPRGSSAFPLKNQQRLLLKMQTLARERQVLLQQLAACHAQAHVLTEVEHLNQSNAFRQQLNDVNYRAHGAVDAYRAGAQAHMNL